MAQLTAATRVPPNTARPSSSTTQHSQTQSEYHPYSQTQFEYHPTQPDPVRVPPSTARPSSSTTQHSQTQFEYHPTQPDPVLNTVMYLICEKPNKKNIFKKYIKKILYQCHIKSKFSL